ncbi:MAG: S-methyl-5'-thioadenosine phosphorylase [Aquificae bacterium]|nr:S-methyl-5'-thioadenosine phosphorylase [Aquificota bacterium]
MLAFIGGSGLYDLPGLEILEEVEVETPFGKPSAPVVRARAGGKEVLFLARHGKNHEYPPHRVPYRANLWALAELGATAVVGINAVGGIDPLLRPGDFVVVDQFLDFTKSRPQTFYEGKFSPDYEPKKGKKHELLLAQKKVVHVDVSHPFCSELRRLLAAVLEEENLRYHLGGTYAATEGPRLESAAEIRALALLGAAVVGMTMVPEVVLARELQLHYAGLCVVTNPAAGIAGRRLTSEEVVSMMKRKEEEIKRVVLRLVERFEGTSGWNCDCGRTLEGAEI